MVGRITKPQIAKIWALARELGLDRDELYQLVPGGSISHMHRTEASMLIDQLERLRSLDAPPAEPPKPAPRPNARMTPRQMHFIHFLLGRLGWLTEPRHVENFLRKYFRVESVEEIRNRRDAGKVIEALKAILKRKSPNRNVGTAT